MIREVAPNPFNLRYVVEHMRVRDRKEITALRWHDDLSQFADDVVSTAGELWRVWEKDGVPVSVVGSTVVRPGVVRMGAFGTKDWQYAVRPMLRWINGVMVPALIGAGFHRGEAYALASSTGTRRFIEAVGGELESKLYHYGRGREDFNLYVWRLDDGRRSILLREHSGDAAIRREERNAADGRPDSGPELPVLPGASEPRQRFANGEGEQQDRVSA